MGRIAETTLTSTQVKALNTTPITLVSAPGSGKAIVVRDILFAMSFNSTAYTGANNLEFRYTDASGAKVTADIAAATLNSTSATKYGLVAGVTTELACVANTPVVVRVPTANPGAGDSTVKIQVGYSIRVTP